MNIKKSILSLIAIFVLVLNVGCDALTADTITKLDTEFVIFQNSEKNATDVQIDNLVDANILQKSQINYRYKNKISGFSADLSESQIDLLKSKEYENSKIIPGEFIIVFIDPFNGKKYAEEEGNKWSMKTIEQLQKKYEIDDKQVLSRYGYALFGFGAELSDKQLYQLEQEEVIDHITPNMMFSLN